MQSTVDARSEQAETEPLDDKEIRRRRRRRRRVQPPDYIEYAKRREQQLNADDERGGMGGKHELWVVDNVRYTGPEGGRDDDVAPVTQGRPKSKDKDIRNESPFQRIPQVVYSVPANASQLDSHPACLHSCSPLSCSHTLTSPSPYSQDILQPQYDKKQQIGVNYKWEDISVSNHVVLRTALPSAPPRVPQLVLSDSHADARTIHDIGPGFAHTMQATRPARSLVGEVYAAETANLGGDEVLESVVGLPGSPGCC